jgi:nicotinamidase-related amidase
MKLINKNIFLENSKKTLGEIYDMIKDLKGVKIQKLPGNETALIIIDMINGFARKGDLKSERTEDVIGDIVALSKACDAKGIKKIAFADCHTDESPEFSSYPAHCLKGTSESEVVDEIKEVGGYKLIPKNSTNGFLEEEFMSWLKSNSDIKNFIVTGVCTDICVQQFSITLKTWFNMQNKKSRVIVPINTVDSYDLGMHNADLVNVMALYNMIINGVEIVKNIEMEV